MRRFILLILMFSLSLLGGNIPAVLGTGSNIPSASTLQADFTVHVPIEISSIDGLHSIDGELLTIKKLFVVCTILTSVTFGSTNLHTQQKEVIPGKYTTTFKFYNIPEKREINSVSVSLKVTVEENNKEYPAWDIDDIPSSGVNIAQSIN